MEEIVEKWENLGLLLDVSDSLKVELATLLEDMYTHFLNNKTTEIESYPHNIDVAMFPAIVRVYRKHKRPFDVVKLHDDYCEFLRTPTTRESIQELGLYRNIDIEAELLSVFCEYYELDKTIDPKKIIKKFKL